MSGPRPAGTKQMGRLLDHLQDRVCVRRHAMVFLAVNAVMVAIGFALSSSSVPAWTLVASGALLLLHWSIARTMTVSEAWADEHAAMVHGRSNDRHSIEDTMAAHGYKPPRRRRIRGKKPLPKKGVDASASKS